jgi:hypothetical protein
MRNVDAVVRATGTGCLGCCAQAAQPIVLSVAPDVPPAAQGSRRKPAAAAKRREWPLWHEGGYSGTTMMSHPSEVPRLLPGAGSRAVACDRSGYVDDRAWSKSLLGAGPYGGSCTSLEDSVSVHRDGVMRRSSANP